MTWNRRQWLTGAIVSLGTLPRVSAPKDRTAMGAPAPGGAATGQPALGRPLLFDGLAIFDLRPVAATAQQLLGATAPAFLSAWRVRQFEYQWLRALSGHYVDFRRATEDSMEFAARSTGLTLPAKARNALMNEFNHLRIWDDVPEQLSRLRGAGCRLALLSNMTEPMLHRGLQAANVSSLFEQVISTDRIQSYKPAAAAYRLGEQTFGMHRSRMLFIAFAGWDVAGAKWFGYPTFWLNRMESPAEVLGEEPDASGRNLRALHDYIMAAE